MTRSGIGYSVRIGDVLHRVMYVPHAKPGRRWWVERQTSWGAWEGAIKADDRFPQGSVYRTERAATAALRRYKAAARSAA